ncbi:hypothetical protein JAAARDRAFT_201224 [Jaapia argillacea MUCL 33604]|uniref:ferric-chelate reductase (NADPH) n=1 Tax=Jaapia argillacea MUCL 33604 TaxID=933084 RepID=A0A067P265_9AGAM|nr:hypothetical protein JAAARDRAFT_201224 [Jaapia argillacea MUCL 33604]
MHLQIPHPSSFHWSPGQSAYFVLPRISTLPFEALPFSIASIDDSSYAPKGLTKRLLDVARDGGGEVKVKVLVDGPYGNSPDLRDCETIVLVAGSGVANCLSLFLDVVSRAREGSNICRRVVFLWAIRGQSESSQFTRILNLVLTSKLGHIYWVASALTQALTDAPPSLQIAALIDVTSCAYRTTPISSRCLGRQLDTRCSIFVGTSDPTPSSG